DRRLPAIIRIEKNAFASEHIALFFKELFHKTEVMGFTGYSMLSTSSEEKQPQGDVKINVICPACPSVYCCLNMFSILANLLQTTVLEARIDPYVHETPELYRRITLPYIAQFSSRADTDGTSHILCVSH
ncbi:hypothetical protein BT96DRAFT_839087, partial [Gymnopus androsaceus JB14]